MTSTPTPQRERMIVQQFLSLLLLAGAVLGCDKVNSLIEQQQPTASAPAAPTALPPTSISDPAPTAVVAKPSAPVESPPPPSPDKVLSDFRALAPALITDGDLSAIAQVPEAAAQITEVDATGSGVTAAGLSQLPKFPKLERLKISRTLKILPDGFGPLGQVSSLVELEADHTQIGAAAAPAVGQLTNLQRLSLNGTQIDSSFVRQLAGLKQLQDLNLSETATNDVAIAAIKDLPLRKLSLNKTAITNDGLQMIGTIETLEELHVAFTGVTGAAFLKPKFANLRILNAGETRFGIEGLVGIKRLRTLEELYLYQTGIVIDNGKLVDPRTNVFKGMPNLKTLVLGRNQISDMGIATVIAGHKELQTLKIDHVSGFSDQGLVRLNTCRNLKLIEASGSQITPSGVQALKSKLPEVVVTKDGQTL